MQSGEMDIYSKFRMCWKLPTPRKTRLGKTRQCKTKQGGAQTICSLVLKNTVDVLFIWYTSRRNAAFFESNIMMWRHLCWIRLFTQQPDFLALSFQTELIHCSLLRIWMHCNIFQLMISITSLEIVYAYWLKQRMTYDWTKFISQTVTIMIYFFKQTGIC